ncbi:MAG: hypothetical protein P1R58_08980 [bacterium]|nr:hypothetical protein [bacterium]
MSFLILGGLMLACPVDAVDEGNLLGGRIARLEEKGELSSTEQFYLFFSHYRLGKFYQSLARCAANVTIEAASCYSEDKKFAWGVEYFAASSALSLGDTARALEFLKQGLLVKGAPPVLLDLQSALNESIRGAQNGTIGSAVNSKSIGHVWDSLEVMIRMAESKPDTRPYSSTLPEQNSNGGVDYAPLVMQTRLRGLESLGEFSQLKKLLREIEEKGAPMWEVSGTKGTASFGDPSLLDYIAHLHFTLARSGSQKALGGGGAKKWPALYTAKTLYELDDVSGLSNLLKSHGNEANLSVYEGWMTWRNGNPDKAQRIWDRVREGADVRSKLDLLLLWTDLPGFEQDARQLRRSLVNEMGSLKEQMRLRRSPKGLQSLSLTYAVTAESFLSEAQFDSAVAHYIASRNKAEVSVDNYDPIYCANYHSAHALYGSPDFRQEGYIGWVELKKHYPSVTAVIEPLTIAIQCFNREFLDIQGSDLDG